MNLDRLHQILRGALADERSQIGQTRVCSAIQAVVWQRGHRQLDEALGVTHFDSLRPGGARPGAAGQPVHRDTPMDIASLTKPLVTATLAMQAVDEGRAEFHTPVADLCPAWSPKTTDHRQATLLDVLNHSSGLPAWHDFYDCYPLDPSPSTARSTRRALVAQIARTALEAPPGRRENYSDLGYILLADILQRLFGDPLDVLARRRIFDPLGMTQTRYVAAIAGDQPLTSAAATEQCPRRKRLIVGAVHDENTDIIGGVSGHAGVFSTAGDLLKFCRHIWQIDAGQAIADPIVSRDVLQFCLSEAARSADGHHLGGWDTPSGELSSAGRGFRAGRTVGHLGFTGTSFWIERDRGLVAILLTNRVYPSRDNELIKSFRTRFHEAVLPPRLD